MPNHGDDRDTGGEQQAEELLKDHPDQYDALLRAMEPGLLITLNNEWGVPSDELKVQYSLNNETEVGLVGKGQDWMITRDNGELVYGRCSEFGLSEQHEVITIEVVGIE